MTHNHFPKAWSVPTRVGPPPPGDGGIFWGDRRRLGGLTQREKPLPHLGHACTAGVYSVSWCFLTWMVRSCFCRKRWLQQTQANGFSPVWVRVCAVRWRSWEGGGETHGSAPHREGLLPGTIHGIPPLLLLFPEDACTTKKHHSEVVPNTAGC